MSFGDFLKSLSFGEALVSSLVIAVFATVSVGIKYFWDKWVLNTVLRNARDLETYNQIEVILTPILD